MKKGFTIIETLVAVAILVMIIVGTMGAVQTAISSYIYSKDQIIAFYLAQEGFEQIRNFRDQNRLAGRNWLYGVAENSNSPCFPGTACVVDTLYGMWPTRCDTPSSCPYLRQAVTGFFAYEPSWTQTPFKRTITLNSINADEISVTVTVNWKKGLVERQFRARENLLNW